MDLLGPDLGKTLSGCPVGQASQRCPTAAGLLRESPPNLSLCPSTATGKNSLPAGLRPQAGIPGPRPAVRGGAPDKGKPPERCPKVPWPWRELSLGSGPKEADLELRTGSPLSVFKRGHQVACYSEFGMS